MEENIFASRDEATTLADFENFGLSEIWTKFKINNFFPESSSTKVALSPASDEGTNQAGS